MPWIMFNLQNGAFLLIQWRSGQNFNNTITVYNWQGWQGHWVFMCRIIAAGPRTSYNVTTNSTIPTALGDDDEDWAGFQAGFQYE